MTSQAAFRIVADAVLYVHFAVVAFNIFWLIAIPLGAWCGWSFVRNFWWRTAHLACLSVVAFQAIAGRLCFLTTIQDYLATRAGGNPEPSTPITRLITHAVFWPLPMWAFVVLYLLALVYAAALWAAVPPARMNAQ